MNEKPVVLIVDDAAENIQTLAQCLKSDYRIKVATGGKRCLELAQTEPAPDLILLDVNMPDLDGYEVIRRLKSCSALSNIPVIFVTAMDQDKDEEKGLALGAVDYVTKPIRPAIVSARVKAHVLLKTQNDQLKKMAMCDQLTGLYNRHYLIESARQKIAFCKRHNLSISMMILDVDRFKHINDHYGHAVGDQVLQAVAHAISERCREEDLLVRQSPPSEMLPEVSAGSIAARYGGEEFVVMLFPCGPEPAQQKAEEIRAAIDTLQPAGIHTSVSIGVAQLRDGEQFEGLVKRADAALYLAKEQGRNRVVVCCEGNEESQSS